MFNTSEGTPFTMNVAPTGTGCGNGMFGGDGAFFWWVIIIIILFGGWGNNGWGNSGGVLDQYTLSSDFATLSRQVDSGFSNTNGLIINNADQLQRQITSVGDGICSLGYDQLGQFNNLGNTITATGTSILNQMNNNAVNAMQDTFALQTAINGVNVNNNTNTQALIAQMTANESARQACCCDNKNLISTSFGNLKYDMAAQDCQIRQTVNDVGRSLADVQNANTQAILAAINSIKEDAKDEKIATLQAELSNARLMENNATQTAIFQNSINEAVKQLTPACPVPSYTVPAPFPYSGCGCSCSCS